MIVRIGMLGKWLAMGVLAAANVLASGQTAGPGKYRIAGRMVNAATGEPVRRASVALLAESDSHTVASVESDGEGQFVFTGLGAGKFQLTASKRGFRTAFYDEHEEYSSAIVTGEGEETGGLVFRLVPGSVLYGVVAGDGGDPVEGARVMLFQRPREHGHGLAGRMLSAGTSSTDDTGAYEFDDLAAGEYLVAVVAEPWWALNRSSAEARQRPGGAALDVAYPVTFFDSTTEEDSATRIVLAEGRREQANINVHAVPALHLTVETPPRADGSVARAELRQTIFGVQVSAQSMGFLDALRTGTVEFNGVAPGRYELAQGDPPRVAQLDLAASQRVDPGLGSPAVSVSGSIRMGPAASDGGTALLIPADGNHAQSALQTACPGGAFSFATVPQGAWELWVTSGGRTLPVSAVTVGTRTRTGNRLVVRDRPLQVVANLNLGDTRVEGFARRAGKGVPGVMVLLAPKDSAAFAALARRDQSDSDGSFSLRDVGPGQYTVVAIEDGWTLDWARADVMARYLARGIAVTVTEATGKTLRLAEPVPVQPR